jgi:hypothetical protein
MDALRGELSARPDDELLRTVTVDAGDFRPEAVAIARQVLGLRGYADAAIEAFGRAQGRGARRSAEGPDRAEEEPGDSEAGWPGAPFQILEGPARPSEAARDSPRCSFCDATQAERRLLIVVRAVSICDGCLATCDAIVASRPARRAAPEGEGDAGGEADEMLLCSLCRSPFDENDGTLIPERGALCPGCVDLVRSVLESPREER